MDDEVLPDAGSYCAICAKAVGSGEEYPIRMLCSCLLCYKDSVLCLITCQNCPVCNTPFGDPAPALQNIENQVERHRQQREELSVLTEKTAGLTLDSAERGGSGYTVLDLQGAFENISAAFAFLGIKPENAESVDIKALELGLSVLGLDDANTVAALPTIIDFLSFVGGRSFKTPSAGTLDI
ncbi:hypothetical protein ACLMJK_006060 [Lecanora helva]